MVKSILDRDPLINEIRRVRRHFTKACHYDIKEMGERLRAFEMDHKKKTLDEAQVLRHRKVA